MAAIQQGPSGNQWLLFFVASIASASLAYWALGGLGCALALLGIIAFGLVMFGNRNGGGGDGLDVGDTRVNNPTYVALGR